MASKCCGTPYQSHSWSTPHILPVQTPPNSASCMPPAPLPPPHLHPLASSTPFPNSHPCPPPSLLLGPSPQGVPAPGQHKAWRGAARRQVPHPPGGPGGDPGSSLGHTTAVWRHTARQRCCRCCSGLCHRCVLFPRLPFNSGCWLACGILKPAAHQGKQRHCAAHILQVLVQVSSLC